MLESPTARKGVESLQGERERIMRRGVVLWAWGLRVRREMGGVVKEKERELGRRGVTTRAELGSEMGWWEVHS